MNYLMGTRKACCLYVVLGGKNGKMFSVLSVQNIGDANKLVITH